MNWKTITAAATPVSIDRLEQLLWELGAVSVTAEDGGNEPLLEPGPAELPLWQEIAVTGMFEQQVDTGQVALRLAAAEFSVLQVNELADKVWEREWLDRFQPSQFGNRLWVCPRELQPPPEAEVVMYLDPGLAFGTGSHPTTRLCLEWLDANLEPGMRVVDYGCGSGILGIAALLLSAGNVVAVDNDPQALAAAAENALTNGVAGKFEAVDSRQMHAGRADLVIANILAQPLIELAPRLQSLAVSGGRLVLSGIMEGQADRVMRAYPRVAFGPPLLLDGWVCLSGDVR